MKKDGFTLTELVVVFGIIVTLFGFATVRLLGAQHKPQLSTTLDILIADLKSQQLRAMSGDARGGNSGLSYGINFNLTSYTFFGGSVFSPSDPGNFTVNVESPMQVVSNLPANQIVFDKGSGEVNNFSANFNTITVKNTESNEQKIITINKLGNIVSVQ